MLFPEIALFLQNLAEKQVLPLHPAENRCRLFYRGSVQTDI
jgi:hypothetical protein